MKDILLFGILFLLSCNSQEKSSEADKASKAKSTDDTSITKKDSLIVIIRKAPLLFLDSISKKYDLSIGQIQKHTIIDSSFYTGRFSDATFKGDAVFDFHNKFKGAIVDYNDNRNCLLKLILVFILRDLQNTDYKEIFSDCDRDESSDFFSLNYELLNDSIFQTTQSHIAKNMNKVSKRQKTKWKINERGKIDSVQQ